MDAVAYIYAKFLGIDIDDEPELVEIARQALDDLPDGWEVSVCEEGEFAGTPFFHNERTGESVWHHPREKVYVKRVKDERKYLEEMKITKERKEKERFRDSKVNKSYHHLNYTSDIDDSSKKFDHNDYFNVEDFDLKTDDFVPPPKVAVQKVKTHQVDDSLKVTDKSQKYNSAIGSFVGKELVFEPGWLQEDVTNFGSKKSTKLVDENRNSITTKSALREGNHSKERLNLSLLQSQPLLEGGSKKGATTSRDIDSCKEIRKPKDEEEGINDSTVDLIIQRSANGDLSHSDTICHLQQENRRLISKHREDTEAKDIIIESLRVQLQQAEQKAHIEYSSKKRAEEMVETLRNEISHLDALKAQQISVEIEKAVKRVNDDWEMKWRSIEIQLENERSLASTLRKRLTECEGEIESISYLRKQLIEEEDKVKRVERRLLVVKEEESIRSKRELESMHLELEKKNSELKIVVEQVRNLQDECLKLSQRASSAVQQSQLAKSECDAIKAEKAAIIADGQTSHLALMQALQRVNQYESEIVRFRTEISHLQSENDTLSTELIKLRGTAFSVDNKAQASDSEIKRLKANFNSEINKLKSNIAELEGKNYILQEEVNRFNAVEMARVSDQNHITENYEREVLHLNRIIAETTEKLHQAVLKSQNLEKDIMSIQDTMHIKDRALNELTNQVAILNAQRTEIRDTLTEEAEVLKKELWKEKEKFKESEHLYHKRIEDIKREVEERLPALISEGVKQSEEFFNIRLMNELNSQKKFFLNQIECSKNNILSIEESYSESISKLKQQLSDDKFQLDHTRKKNQILQSSIAELEKEVDALKTQGKKIYSSNRKYLQEVVFPQTEDESTYAMQVVSRQLSVMKHELSKSLNASTSLLSKQLEIKQKQDSYALDEIKLDYENNIKIYDSYGSDAIETDIAPRNMSSLQFPYPKQNSVDRSVGENLLSETRLLTPVALNSSWLEVDDFTTGFHEGYWKTKYRSQNV